MQRYEAIESKRWKHSSGRTASLCGAVPWSNARDKAGWSIETVGYTLRDNRLNTVGTCRAPFATLQEAEKLATELNSK